MSRLPHDEMILDCPAAADRLPAFADGALATLDRAESAAVERHVARCAACAAELRALRDTLDRLRRLPAGPEKEPRFWMDFERNVRLAYDARVEKRRLGARIGRFVFAFAAAASVALALRLTVHTGSHGAADAGSASTLATPAPPGPAPDPLGLDDDLDPEEIIDHLGAEDLARVGKALGEGA